jgi:fumarate hydratase subunit beta
MDDFIKIETPLIGSVIDQLKMGDRIAVYGTIYTGRDATLPRLVKSIQDGEKLLDLEGAVIMHTAVSPAGIAPTSSNKTEIENSIATLSRAGVRMYIGKGSLNKDTVSVLEMYESVFVVTPPAAALLTSKVISSKKVAFPDEGMEAIYQLKVEGIPGIVAVIHGESIY